MTKRYMALSPNFYGYGETPEEAKRNLKKMGGNLRRCGLYEVPEDYWIDELGNAHAKEPAKFISGTDLRR